MTADSTGSDAQFDEIYQQLRREYLSEADDRLAELRADAATFAAGEAEAIRSLKTRFHRLAGSGGSHGFPEIGRIAREAEQWIASGPAPDGAAQERLAQAIQRLAEEFARARSR
jgi:HPt (histidine-containing phosphotransfer) domain-containing protein